MSEGELPVGWATAQIGDLPAPEANSLTDGPFGSKLKSTHYVASGVRVVRLGNIGVGTFNDIDRAYIEESHYQELKKHAIGPGDLVVAALAEPVGRCCEIPKDIGPALVKADCLRFKPTQHIEPRFVMHWLNSPIGRKAVEELTHGIGRLRINIQDLKKAPIPLAPQAEQRRIVEKIEALTARSRRAREALDALPALIDRYRQSILAAAFRGDLTADWREAHPEVETATAFLARNGVRGEEVEAEDIPVKLPETWRWARLSDVAEVKGGLAKGKKRPAGVALESVPYLRVANVQRGFLDLSQVKEIEATAEEVEQLRLRRGDILFNEGGDRDKLGRGWVWSGEIDRCIHQNHVFRARLLSAEINPFLISHFGNTFGQKYFFGEGKQSVNLASISLSKLKAFPVPVIPPAEQVVLCARIEEALRRVEVFRAAWRSVSERLPALDQSILAKAFRGELVPQDPDDEPASVLLERIRAESVAAGEKPRRGRARKAG
ncbi:restriction endonuclease subunit S [Azospirillum tabaci]|uniref:restriction endonuclease subunit S n=1 Tax=Azospirillum tabaci TaxID=2752310 RepID=UPI001661719E|nr:restriction endonuclease subunit S [Azospirillum tabaci]